MLNAMEIRAKNWKGIVMLPVAGVFKIAEGH